MQIIRKEKKNLIAHGQQRFYKHAIFILKCKPKTIFSNYDWASCSMRWASCLKCEYICERPCKIWPNYVVDAHYLDHPTEGAKKYYWPIKVVALVHHTKLKKSYCAWFGTLVSSHSFWIVQQNAGCSPFQRKIPCTSSVKDKQASIHRRLISEDILISEIEHW